MSLVAVFSAKGSPGATTTAHVLARFWPVERTPVLVECDPMGGDLALRLGVPATPGLLSLAASLRERLSMVTLQHHVRSLPGGELALLGPATETEATSSVAACAAALAALAVGNGELDLIVDCGRLASGSPAEVLVRAADTAVLVVRNERRRPHDTAVSVRHARDLLARLGDVRRPSVVLVGRGPYGPAEIEAAVGATALGRLPVDRWSVERLLTAPTGRRDAWLLERFPLPRAAKGVVSGVLEAVAGPGPSPGREAEARSVVL